MKELTDKDVEQRIQDFDNYLMKVLMEVRNQQKNPLMRLQQAIMSRMAGR